MGARENILARIRSQLGKSGATTKQELDVVANRLREHPVSPRPPMDWPDLTERFKSQALNLLSTVDEVDHLGDVPAALARYVEDSKLNRRAVCWPALGELDWRAAGLQVEARTVRDGDLIGITGSYCAIAETGTLMLLSGAQTAAATSLLPDTHIAIVRAARIVPGMEEAWNLMRHEHGEPPRAVNFVSGPSRTGDIEMHIVLGAHGPYRVHIIVVRGDSGHPDALITTDWWRRPSAVQ